MSAQEEERARIANDIHDDSVQKMTAVGMRLETLRRTLDVRDQPVIEALQASVSVAISSLRNLLFDLRPPSLDSEGLGTAVREYLRQALQESGIDGRLSDHLVEPLSLETRTIAYRIAQEAVTNARKHSRAAMIDVRLDSRDGGVYGRVEDDGEGFVQDVADEPRPGHLGFSAMRERAEVAGGWWRAHSASGDGTKVEFWLPNRTREAEPRSARGQKAAIR